VVGVSNQIKIEIKITGGKKNIEDFAKIEPEQMKVEYRDWELKNEIEEFQGLDIGLYPLLEDDWTRGKCGFKAIQYMAAGVPCIASPVGTNLEVIEDGRNGLLAESPAEWEAAMIRLLTDLPFREKVIEEGYRTVRERYSLAVHGPRLAGVIRDVCGDWERGERGETRR
jgi:glycosyltransferase involved in cell wall biosynthesis